MHSRKSWRRTRPRIEHKVKFMVQMHPPVDDSNRASCRVARWLIAVAVALSTGTEPFSTSCDACVCNACVDEPVNKSGQKEEGFTKLNATELESLVDSFAKSERIITALKPTVRNSEILYTGASRPNEQKSPWIVLVGMSREEFERKDSELKAERFELEIHETISLSRQVYHCAVWIQKQLPSVSLTIPEGDLPVSGQLGKELTPVNDLLRDVLQKNNLPGVTAAIAVDGKLVYERAFGYADVDTSTAMLPATTMRIASVSKPLTAVAVLLLVQEGKLTLDDTALSWLEKHEQKFDSKSAVDVDARWSQVTIRHLLNHSAGFDRDKSKDTMFQLVQITRAAGLKTLATIPDIIRYQLRQPLDFDPGQKFVYSNVGYCLLGRIIEAVSGEPYADFVRKRILEPAGMQQTRLGRTRLSELAPDEAHYFRQQRHRYPLVYDVARGGVDGKIESVEAPYGLWDITVMDAHGGWTSTAGDLVRFIAALENSQTPILTRESLALMKGRPILKEAGEPAVWYGMGWSVRDIGNDQLNYWHTGLLDGTSTELVHRWDNISWCVLFNCDRNPDEKRSADLVDGPMHLAIHRAIEQGLIGREEP